MHWKVKSHAMALISRLPGGRHLYHSLQRHLGMNRLSPSEGTSRALEIVDLIRKHGGELHGAKCLGIGTGWRPFLPIILHLAGAKRVLTMDVNPWLTFQYAIDTVAALRQSTELIASRLGVAANELDARLAAGLATADLDGLLETFGIVYALADASNTD